MGTLYEITGQYRQLFEMLEDADHADEQIIKDTIESMNGEFEEKADSYARIIKELLAESKKFEDEKKRLEETSDTLKRRAKMLKDHLCNAMELTGNLKFKTNLFSFSIQNNGGIKPLEIMKDKEIPDEYTKKEPDNEKIRMALEQGIILDFALLKERGKHLRIK